MLTVQFTRTTVTRTLFACEVKHSPEKSQIGCGLFALSRRTGRPLKMVRIRTLQTGAAERLFFVSVVPSPATPKNTLSGR